MAITTAVCTSFKQELAQALHDFTNSTGNVFKIALYTSSATMDATTTAYSATNEVSGTGYSAGGNTLTNTTPSTTSTTAFWSFSNTSWTTATITARGCLIYNSTNSNRAVAVFDFGSDIASTAGTFTITFPTNNSSSAILRIA